VKRPARFGSPWVPGPGACGQSVGQLRDFRP
jgi:hypothetical protein